MEEPIRSGWLASFFNYICPLQLEVIRRCVLLYSNPGEVVFSPFAGIGSEGFIALGGRSPKTKRSIDDPRRSYGCELKAKYFEQAKKELESGSIAKQIYYAGQLVRECRG